ncbi:MAG: methylmalonyl-CoA mutase family protein [Jatrophihabitantaceae bacterium]
MSAVPAPPPPEIVSLAAEFPAATDEQWRELAAGVLRKSGLPADVDPEAALTTLTYDDIAIKPLYTATDVADLPDTGLPGQAPFVRGASAAAHGWDVRQRHTDPDAKVTNAAILADLTNGATSIWLGVGERGVAVEELTVALDGVYLELAPIALDAGADTQAAVVALLALAERGGIDPSALQGTLGADPIGLRARTGAAADLALLPALAGRCRSAANLRIATVDATIYHDAGASDAQELGIAAAVGVAYLRALTESVDIDAALARLEFRYAVTADQFLSIAKLRAARRIWDRIAELSGASDSRAAQQQHAVTSAAMMTQRDPWVNLLRTTIACFGAAVGGAQAITVAPFDSAIGLPDAFGRRIARNTQAVLHDESSLGRVVDAAGGSWYVESLTDSLAQAAWTVFTDIEKNGGALAGLEDGTVADLLARTQARRADDVAHRRAPITGVSEYAFIGEEPVVRPAPVPARSVKGALPTIRYAADFEALRDCSDAAPSRPKVFLAALGPVAAHTGRVGFAANLFQAAGIEAVVGTGDPDELVTAFRASGTTVACLCSSDKIYAERATSEAAALKAAGARHVWIAGQPGKDEQTDHSAGIDGYVYTGCDALDVLRTTLDLLGVSA